MLYITLLKYVFEHVLHLQTWSLKENRTFSCFLPNKGLWCFLIQGETVWSCHNVIQMASKVLDGNIDWHVMISLVLYPYLLAVAFYFHCFLIRTDSCLLSPLRKVMCSSMFVCLFVCLFVSDFVQKLPNWFACICRVQIRSLKENGTFSRFYQIKACDVFWFREKLFDLVITSPKQ